MIRNAIRRQLLKQAAEKHKTNWHHLNRRHAYLVPQVACPCRSLPPTAVDVEA